MIEFLRDDDTKLAIKQRRRISLQTQEVRCGPRRDFQHKKLETLPLCFLT
jgi:hypothetical protein